MTEPKSPRQIIAEHIVDFAVDQPGPDTWKDWLHNADSVIQDLAAEGWVIVKRESTG